MAQCVYSASTSAGTAVRIDDANCQFYLLDPTEYTTLQGVLANAQNSISLEDIFLIPEASALGLMFQTSFSLVLIFWLTAWAYGSVVNYFSPKHER